MKATLAEINKAKQELQKLQDQMLDKCFNKLMGDQSTIDKTHARIKLLRRFIQENEQYLH